MKTNPFADLSRNQIEYLIDEWIICKRNTKRNREILKLALLDGISQEAIAEEYGLAVRQVQNIIYETQKQLLKHL